LRVDRIFFFLMVFTLASLLLFFDLGLEIRGFAFFYYWSPRLQVACCWNQMRSILSNSSSWRAPPHHLFFFSSHLLLSCCVEIHCLLHNAFSVSEIDSKDRPTSPPKTQSLFSPPCYFQESLSNLPMGITGLTRIVPKPEATLFFFVSATRKIYIRFSRVDFLLFLPNPRPSEFSP